LELAVPVLDLRPLAPPERHRLVYEQLDALAPGETLELVNDHRPSPLRYELEATRPGQYRWVDGDDGPDTWTAAITCTARIVDARPILARGDEPFGTIMAAVAELQAGQPLVVLAPFEPVPLEGVLSAQGFTWSANMLDGGDWRVVFSAGG
jgi:uncharacterized protein (DUF2249 family)